MKKNLFYIFKQTQKKKFYVVVLDVNTLDVCILISLNWIN